MLIAAAMLFIWVKKNQRGKPERTTIPIEAPVTQGSDPFVRDTTHLIYSKHAKCRMDCREIDESEVKEIIAGGEINYQKVDENAKGKTYPLEGITHDKQRVRIVVAPHDRDLVIVTVIDLDTEWKCNCY
jgi:hypothetical protein